MPWWSWRPGSAGGNGSDTDEDSSVRSTVRVGVPAQREPGRVGIPATELPKAAELAKTESPEQVSEVTLTRLGKALEYHGTNAQ